MDKREPREGAEVIKLSSAERREDREASYVVNLVKWFFST